MSASLSDDNQINNGDGSAAIDVDGLIGPDENAAPSFPSISGNGGQIIAQNPVSDDIIPNETVLTNDRSVVGEVKPIDEDNPEEEIIPDASALPFAANPNRVIGGRKDNADGDDVDDNQTLPLPQQQPDAESADTGVPTIDTSPVAELIEPTPVVERPEPVVEPIETPQIMPSPIPDISVPQPISDDSDKIDFIKTYTAEYDETLLRAAETINKILESVDQAMHEKLASILIPEDANEFLDKAPTDGAVHSFEDVRVVVKTVMDKAVEAKQQSQAAAEEAGRIYDEVQAFKRETKQQISDLTSENSTNL